MRSQVEDEDEHSRVLNEIQSMIFHILKFPLLPLPFRTPYSQVAASSSSSWSLNMRHLWATLLSSQVSPAALASLFLGISLALMLFGSLAFVIGFVLLPWVTALVLAFYAATAVSTLSRLGRILLGSSPMLKDMPRSDLLKS
ncbi:uncharacterized protein LOC114728611 isoform X2 [Neltuma alba]|uniref:uncharacterized protein LOC114728611 isoform X2 n=1 Tax=Neltuma alba TaxID=207710 RepID=UPI0010A4723C|nr:uncharacterized protein LOC114728611 isoform X2 [Prosopis alba]